MKDQSYVLKCASVFLLILMSGFGLNAQNEIELNNDTLHLKLDLTRGGAINYISKSGSTRSVVNIADEGRYIQQSYYAGKTLNRIADGQNPAWSPWSWNPIQVGDSYRNRAQILEHSKNGNTLYVKCIPMLWDMNNKPAEAEMEQWTSLTGNVIKVHCKLTCHRTDTIYGEGISNHQELPAVYPVSALKNLYSYFGDFPFTGEALVNPKVINLASGFWGRYENEMVTENWMAFVDDNKWGLGVYTPVCTDFLAGMAGNPGYEATDGSTSYIAPIKRVALNKNSIFEYDYYLVIGSLNQIRSQIYALKGVQANAWEFTDDLEGWSADMHGGSVVQSAGKLKFSVTGVDPHVYKNVPSWEVKDLRYLWLKIKNETAANSGAFSFFSEAGDSVSLPFMLTPTDTGYRDILFNLDTMNFWTSDLKLNRFKLEPVTSNNLGDVYVDFIRFLKDLIKVRSFGDAIEIKGIGKSLQLFAEEIPLLNTIGVNWSVDNQGVATINASGLLTGVSEGVVTVTGTAKDGSGKSGIIRILITDTGKKTAWEFTNDLENWDKNPNGGTVSHSEGSMKFTVTAGDPYVYSNVTSWKFDNLKYVWMRIKNETAGSGGAFYFFPASGGFELVSFLQTPTDSLFRDVFVDLRNTAVWKKNTVLNNIRLDPNNGGETGNIYFDFIRFMEELVNVSSEGEVSTIVGLGNTLQMYAEVMVSEDAAGVTWKVDKPEVASVDSTGLLTSISNGVVEVTATAKDGSGVSGSRKITVSIDNTSLSIIKDEHLKIYPNPVSKILNIDNASEIQTVAIVNAVGTVVLELSNIHSVGSINTGELKSGIYLLRATSFNGNTSSARFIKN
jgi:hypothetical protein